MVWYFGGSTLDLEATPSWMLWGLENLLLRTGYVVLLVLSGIIRATSSCAGDLTWDLVHT